MAFYTALLLPLAVATAAVAYLTRPSAKEAIPKDFDGFKNKFLIGYSVCVLGDVLCFPYVMVVWMTYTFTPEEIGQIVGFAQLLGIPLVWRIGPAADRWGRKKVCIAYCAMYTVACVLAHVRLISAMIVSATLLGLSQCILQNVFEVWMVSEHTVQRTYSGSLLSYMFALMFNWQNAVKIISGLLVFAVTVNHTAAPVYQGAYIWFGGILNTYALAIVFHIGGAIYISQMWSENYGDLSNAEPPWDSLKAGWAIIRKEKGVRELGILIACFDGAVLSFTMHFAKAMQIEVVSDVGLLVSGFHMAGMIGTASGKIMYERMGSSFKVAAQMMIACCVGSAVALASVALTYGEASLQPFCGLALVVFMFFHGWYRPWLSMLKGELVPESNRATVYNIYDILAKVLGTFLTVRGEGQAFGYSACALVVAALCVADLYRGRPLEDEGDAFWGTSAKQV